MKKSILRIAAVAVLLSATLSCVKERSENATQDFERVSLTAVNFVWSDGPATKTHISPEADFTWADGDVVGIYPDVGTQVRFPIIGKEGDQTNQANFTGGGWAVKNANRYMAYYPFISDMELDKEAIPVNYTGQRQNGFNSTSHLSSYDFMAASGTAPKNGEISFDFDHMSALLRLNLTVPKVGEYKTLTLSCDTPFVTKGTVDITAATPEVNPTHWSNEFVVNLENCTTTVTNQAVVIYVLIPPVDLSNKTIRVNLRGDHSDCETFFSRGPGKPFVSGHAYAPTMDPMAGGDVIKLVNGRQFNEDIKSLANGESYIYDKTDYRIQSISFEVNNSAEPNLPYVDVSAPESPAPIYAYWNSSTKALVIRTPANRVYPGEDASGLFAHLDGVATIDFDNFDLTYAKDVSEMFLDCAHLTSLDLSGWNTSKITNFGSLFSGCKELETLDISSFSVESATSLGSMFNGCESLASLDLRHFRTSPSALWDLTSMFNGCASLASLQFGSDFNTDSVSRFYYMFAGCSSLTNLDISMFDTSGGTDIRGMFSNCEKLANLTGSIDITDKVTNLSRIFFNCHDLSSINVSGWDVSHVTDLSLAFYECASLTSLAVDNWVVGSVTTFANMFNGCSSLETLDVSGWNTSEGLDLSNMFKGCENLSSIDISNFITNNAKDLSGMFGGCSSLTSLNLSNFNTSKANYIRAMFEGCTGIESLDLSSFDISHVLDMSRLFKNCSSLSSVTYGTFDTHYCESFDEMYAGTGFTSLDLTFFNTSSAKNVKAMFKECQYLTSLDISSFNTSHINTSMGEFLRGCRVLASIDFGPNFSLYGPWYFATDLAATVGACTIKCTQDFKNAWDSTVGVYMSGGATLTWIDTTTGDPLE